MTRRASLRGRLAALVALTCGLALVAGAPAAAPSAASAPALPGSGPLTAEQVDGAVARLKADPLLPGVRKERVLRWKPDDVAPEEEEKKKVDKEEKDDGHHPVLAWIGAFADAIAGASRVLVWGLGATALAVLLVTARHLVIAQRDTRRLRSATRTVQRVGELDVRPESLPEDVGATAWAQWQRGDVAGALSLLYRGALSRLIHRFDVPLTDASTENECLQLARPRLGAPSLQYFARLVRAWQTHTYGGRPPDATEGLALCAGFGAGMEGGPVPAAAPAPALVPVPAPAPAPGAGDGDGFADTEPNA